MGTAVNGHPEWLSGLKNEDAIQLPTADHVIERAGDVTRPALSFAERQFVKRAQNEPVGLILIGEPAFDLVVGVNLWLAGVSGSASIVDAFVPPERVHKLQTLR